MDWIEVPKVVSEVLSIETKHPVRENFNELHFPKTMSVNSMWMSKKTRIVRRFVNLERSQSCIQKNSVQLFLQKTSHKNVSYLKTLQKGTSCNLKKAA